MARVAMSALISHIRLLISDPAGATETFSDDELVTFADARSVSAPHAAAQHSARRRGDLSHLDSGRGMVGSRQRTC